MIKLDSLLKTLSEAPENQIDPLIATRLGGLQGGNQELIAHELKGILDECAQGALASEFAMWVLDHAWGIAKTR